MSLLIDTHSHILPHLDDGSKTIEQSIKIANQASHSGITIIAATPHKIRGVYDFSVKDVDNQVKKLNTELRKRRIRVKILFGAENYADYQMDLKFTLNHKRYFLLEFPMQEYPAYSDKLIDNILNKKLIPIIAHPEKNTQLMKKPEIIENLINKGCLMQLNTDSLYKGPKLVKDFALFLLRNNAIHLISSNAHNESGYELFPRARNILLNHISEDQVKKLSLTIPRKVIKGMKYSPEAADFKEKFHTNYIRRLFK